MDIYVGRFDRNSKHYALRSDDRTIMYGSIHRLMTRDSTETMTSGPAGAQYYPIRETWELHYQGSLALETTSTSTAAWAFLAFAV